MVKAGKTSLELGARHAEVVHSAIKHWTEISTISRSQATLLADTIAVRGFDWEKFAKYSLRLAVLFFVVAVTSVVFEESFVRIYRRLIALPPWLRSVATGAVAMGAHLLAHRRCQSLPEQIYANEAIHAVGGLFWALAAFQLLEQLKGSFDRATQRGRDESSQPKGEEGGDKEHQEKRKQEVKKRERLIGVVTQSVMLGLATVYGTVGLISRSNFIWSCSLIVLGYCCGATTGYM